MFLFLRLLPIENVRRRISYAEFEKFASPNCTKIAVECNLNNIACQMILFLKNIFATLIVRFFAKKSENF